MDRRPNIEIKEGDWYVCTLRGRGDTLVLPVVAGFDPPEGIRPETAAFYATVTRRHAYGVRAMQEQSPDDHLPPRASLWELFDTEADARLAMPRIEAAFVASR